MLHAGTALAADGGVVSAGGRVLAVTAVGADLAAARQAAYERVAGVRLAGRALAHRHRAGRGRGAHHLAALDSAVTAAAAAAGLGWPRSLVPAARGRCRATFAQATVGTAMSAPKMPRDEQPGGDRQHHRQRVHPHGPAEQQRLEHVPLELHDQHDHGQGDQRGDRARGDQGHQHGDRSGEERAR